MAGEVLLDTNVVVEFLGDLEGVEEKLLNQFSEVLISPTVLGEIIYGALHSVRVDENLARIEALLVKVSIATLDAATSSEYGRIKQQLRVNGRLIPDNDIWIAACCTQHKLTLLTRDKHFLEVNGLSLIMW